MWLEFAGAVLVSAVLLYVPGFFVGRAFSIGKFASAVLAPLYTGIVLLVLGVVLEKAGVSCGGIVLAALALAVCLAVWAVVALIRKARTGKGSDASAGADADARSDGGAAHRVDLLATQDFKQALKVAGLYIGVAFIVAAFVYLVALGDPNAFSRHDDSTMHIAAIRGFMDTGTYSTLNVSAYLDQGLQGAYYPAEWYVPVAVIASLFAGNVILANNAVTFAFLVFVFPLAMCLLIRRLFPNNNRIWYVGSLFSLAFAGFPWGFLVFGQLLPNMMSFMFVPLVLVLVVEATEVNRRSDIVKLAFAAFIGLLSVACAQPNGAFTCGIWVVLYAMSRFFYEPGSSTATISSKRVVGAVVLFVVACGLWLVAFNAPFLQSVVQYTREAMLRPHEAIAAGLLFVFTWREGMQPFLTVVVLAGVVYTVRNRRYLWMSVAYVLALVLYVVSMSTEGIVKQVLTGFWYTDYFRTGAMTALFAIPLAVLGFNWLLKLLMAAFSRIGGASSKEAQVVAQADRPGWTKVVPVVILVGVMVVCQFAPYSIRYNDEITAKSGLPKIQEELFGYYSWEKGLTKEECAFTERVMSEIPDGALIVNVPRDGSCWLYGVEGANMFFRRSTNTGREDAESSKLLRRKLCDISTNQKVRDLVDKLDARYVLQLDAGTEEEATTTELRYDEDSWTGIESISEDTPGFTLLLSEGDMRLYQVDPAAKA